MARCSRLPCRTLMPEYKKAFHIGNCYAPCPFSTQASIKRVRIMLRDLVYTGSISTDLLAVVTDIHDPNYGNYVIQDADVDTVIFNVLGYTRNDHTTFTGNREDTNNFGADDYLKYPTFSGSVYMATQAKGSLWGFECAFNDCSYRQHNNGVRYFHT